MIIYIIASIILGVIILYGLWKYSPSKWISVPIILLMTISVYSGRWHRHFEPHKYQFAYQRRLSHADDTRSKLHKQLIEFKNGDNGEDFFIRHRSVTNLADTQYQAINAMASLGKHQPPKSASDYQQDLKSRRIIINGIHQELRSHKIYYKTIAEDHLMN